MFVKVFGYHEEWLENSKTLVLDIYHQSMVSFKRSNGRNVTHDILERRVDELGRHAFNLLVGEERRKLLNPFHARSITLYFQLCSYYNV
jgi:hypothetical protein